VRDYKLSELYELLLHYFEDYVDYTERKRDLNRIKDSLKEQDHMRNIQKKLDELKREEKLIKDEIDSSINNLNIVDDIKNEQDKIDELIQNIDIEIAFIKDKVETKEEILKQINSEITHQSSDNEKIKHLLEEKNTVERILKKWKINQNSLHFIMEVIGDAVERSEEKQLDKLLDSTLDKFNHLTGNQYITRIDADTVLRMIKENKITEDMNPSVIHALLLSIKFSLSDFIIDRDLSLPMLIDDPFLFMDEERCTRLRDLIAYVSSKRQVIIFTHQRDKKDWGNFIEL
jgi:uncharacterized protein YhaN